MPRVKFGKLQPPLSFWLEISFLPLFYAASLLRPSSHFLWETSHPPAFPPFLSLAFHRSLEFPTLNSLFAEAATEEDLSFSLQRLLAWPAACSPGELRRSPDVQAHPRLISLESDLKFADYSSREPRLKTTSLRAIQTTLWCDTEAGIQKC